jgi:hypothetical protein
VTDGVASVDEMILQPGMPKPQRYQAAKPVGVIEKPHPTETAR